MFSVSMTAEGFRWNCSAMDCQKSRALTTAEEAASDAVGHIQTEHPELTWTPERQQVANAIREWLVRHDLVSSATVSALGNAQWMSLVNMIYDITSPAPPSHATLTELVDEWGASNVDALGDIRLVDMPVSDTPPRNWTTNHEVNWSVGEAIQMPPQGKGCKAYGARVGENAEICALPRHNQANVDHVFAIGGRVTRIGK